MGFCRKCGVEAPTKYVSFHQNIGALVMRFSKSISAELCKNCIKSTFTEFTLITATVGWFGFISIIITPFIIINNVVYRISASGLEEVPPDAKVPTMQDIFARIVPYEDEILQRFNNKEPMSKLLAISDRRPASIRFM